MTRCCDHYDEATGTCPVDDHPLTDDAPICARPDCTMELVDHDDRYCGNDCEIDHLREQLDEARRWATPLMWEEVARRIDESNGGERMTDLADDLRNYAGGVGVYDVESVDEPGGRTSIEAPMVSTRPQDVDPEEPGNPLRGTFGIVEVDASLRPQDAGLVEIAGADEAGASSFVDRCAMHADAVVAILRARGWSMVELAEREPCYACGELVEVDSDGEAEYMRGGAVFCGSDCVDDFTDAAVRDELATGGRDVPPAWRAFQILRGLDHEEVLNAGAEGWGAQGRDGALDVLDVARTLVEGGIAIDSDDPRVLLAFHLLRDAGDDRGGQRPAEVPQPIRGEAAETIWRLYRALTSVPS